MDRKLVLIEWLDSKGSGALWEHLDEIESMLPDRVRSAGLLIEETQEYITVVQSLGTAQVLGRLTIPRSAIVRLIELDFDATLSPHSKIDHVEGPMRREKLGEGLVRVRLTPEEKKKNYSVSEARVRDMVCSIGCSSIGDEIVEKYRETEKRIGGK